MSSITSRLRFTIGTKLVSLVAALLMISVVSLVWQSTRMFVESDTALIQQSNADTAANLATQTREMLTSVTEKMRILGTVLMQTYNPPELKDRLVSEFFTKDKDFLAVFIEKVETNGAFSTQSRALSPEMTALEDPTGVKSVTAVQKSKFLSFGSVAAGEVQVSALEILDNTVAVAVAVPFMQDAVNPSKFTHILVALIKQTRFAQIFSASDMITSFMVDRQGRPVAHPDAELLSDPDNDSLLKLAIVKQMLEGKFNNNQTRYVDPDTQTPKLGAYRLVGFGGLGVVAEVVEAKAFEAARRVEYRSALVAWIILCLSFLLGYVFSGTITSPIKVLMNAAHRISQGDFKINIKPRGQDELAHLSRTFNEMALGLEERDRVKETFNKFHNKEIAEKLLSGEVKLGGERKEATVFFSDVRGFTALSESMEPEQVVEMLNEYMTRMVGIIRSYNGIVDKYVGDAIMAIWGVPLTGTDDSYKAVRACLAMREDLEKLNQLRLSRGQPVLKIGMGLNCGPLIAGNIGSDEKMEYTVIGDAVNLASRIESMTKEYGTDLLISSSIHSKISNRFIFETAGSTKVKGKTDAIVVYKVQGYYNDQGQPVLVQTPYSSYAAEKSDKVVHEDKHEAAPTEVTQIASPQASSSNPTQATSHLKLVPNPEAPPPAPPEPVNATQLVAAATPVPASAPALEQTKTGLTKGSGLLKRMKAS